MIFVDTSALYALLDASDLNHQRARAVWIGLLDSGRPLFTSNYVMVESFALTQNRLGFEAARTLQTEILPAIEIRWVDETVHSLAVAALLAAGRRKLSLVDCSSFVVMRDSGARTAFAFDRHFVEEGFLMLDGSRREPAEQ